MKFLGWAAFYEGATDRSTLTSFCRDSSKTLFGGRRKTKGLVLPAPVVPVGTFLAKSTTLRGTLSIEGDLDSVYPRDTEGGTARVHNRAGAYCDAIRELCERRDDCGPWPPGKRGSRRPPLRSSGEGITYQGRARDRDCKHLRVRRASGDPKAALTDAYGRARSRIRVRGAHALLPTLAKLKVLRRCAKRSRFARSEEIRRSALQVLK